MFCCPTAHNDHMGDHYTRSSLFHSKKPLHTVPPLRLSPMLPVAMPQQYMSLSPSARLAGTETQ